MHEKCFSNYDKNTGESLPTTVAITTAESTTKKEGKETMVNTYKHVTNKNLLIEHRIFNFFRR